MGPSATTTTKRGTERNADAPRLIRRYRNRKLYDVEAGRYVTLDQLARLVARGCEISVVDRKSGADLTSTLLAQALLALVKRGASQLPRQLLARLVRLAAGGGPGLSAWPDPQQAAGRARREAERVVARLLGRGLLGLDEALAVRHELGLLVQRAVSEAQAGVESRLRALVGRGESVAGRSIKALGGTIRRFERYLETPAGRPAKRAAGRTTGRGRPRRHEGGR